VLILIRCSSALAGPRPVSTPSPAQIGSIVTEFLSQLGMSAEVTVVTAPVNDKMVSVERITGAEGQTAAFRLCFDEQFLASLDPEELRAAAAHEVGHIWIFSHHPYLQTEALANEIAMKLVSRESLRKVYGKLWTHLGVSGNIEELLGTEKIHAADNSIR